MYDGAFFSYIMSSTIFCVGLLTNIILLTPKFELFALLGGICWTAANILTVLTIQLIGIALSSLLWGGSSLIVGW
jgi:hypothetical protein